MIKVSAFRWVPDFARGLVRDLRVRWALEEAGLPYEVRLLSDGEKDTAEYRALQPFGQVPIYQEDDLVLFESGAILQHIADKSEVLMPRDAASRAHVIAWMFSALNSIEPSVLNVVTIDLFNADQDWAKTRRPAELAKVVSRFVALNERLGKQDYLEAGRFTVADILMTTVLRNLRHCDLVAQYPALNAYVKRCEARPAFKRALDAQMADFEDRAA
jgi:glutathione S-transferase